MINSVKDAFYSFMKQNKSHKIYQLSILVCLFIWIFNQFSTGDSLTYLQPIESTFYFYAVIGMIIGQKRLLYQQ